eukprot:18506-Amphidinium_carterae.1
MKHSWRPTSAAISITTALLDLVDIAGGRWQGKLSTAGRWRGKFDLTRAKQRSPQQIEEHRRGHINPPRAKHVQTNAHNAKETPGAGKAAQPVPNST